MSPTLDPAADLATGGRLVAPDGRELLLTGVELCARAAGGRAWVTLVQRFQNPFEEPLRLRYLVPLPADAAVSGYEFEVGERRVRGVVRSREEARADFERALVEGRSAALLEQERSSLFSQELGNVPPGESVEVRLELDQPLAWLPEGAWEWRFPTVVAPRYQGTPGRVQDAGRQRVDVSGAVTPARCTLALEIADQVAAASAICSPSHPLEVEVQEASARVLLAASEGAALDRDLVVRWNAAAPEPGVRLELARPGEEHAHAEDGYGLLSLVPPAPAEARRCVPRDLIVLLDTSGSMRGEPLDQARRVVASLIESLGVEDRIELIEFSDRARSWKRTARRATPSNRKSALRWLNGLRAAGCTEMLKGIRAALAGLRAEAQRQVLLVSDGMIGFESEVVGLVRSGLSSNARLHVLGVGHGVNRSLTAAAARAGRGAEYVVAPGEDVGRITERLLACTREPLVVDLQISGSALRECAPGQLPDLFAGAPSLVPLALDPAGGRLELVGRTPAGVWRTTLEVAAQEPGTGEQGIGRLYARERVEELELALSAGGERSDVDASVEALGLAFGIATRRTSFVAVAEEPSVDPREPGRMLEVPHLMTEGLCAEGLGLRPAQEELGDFPFMAGMLMSAPLEAESELLDLGEMPRTTLARRSCRGGSGRGPGDEIFLNKEQPAPEEPELVLHARIVLLEDGRLVVELELAQALDWEPTELAQLELSDAESLELRVDPGASTRSGQLAAGTLVRLVLELPAPLVSTPVRIVLGAHTLELEAR